MPSELYQRKLWNIHMSKSLRYMSHTARSWTENMIRHNLSLINQWEAQNERP